MVSLGLSFVVKSDQFWLLLRGELLLVVLLSIGEICWAILPQLLVTLVVMVMVVVLGVFRLEVIRTVVVARLLERS